MARQHNFIDMVGFETEYLTVVKFHGIKNKKTIWECECSCGNVCFVSGDKLRLGLTKSCGCLMRKMGAVNSKKHGLSGSRIYHIYLSMIARCYKKHEVNYKNYGARGIKVCDEWKASFESFYEWAMKNGYSDNLSIDRINNDGDYEPFNCRWVDNKTQANNKRNNILIKYNGEEKTLKEWAEFLNMPYKTIHSRIRYCGWDVEKAFTEPIRKRGA